MSPKIKICGTTNCEDAALAISCGASYIGLIFADSSPRRIDIEAAKNIAAAVAGQCPLVGIFQNTPRQDVLHTFSQIPLDFVQLHGDETIEYCSQLGVPVIKVLSLGFKEPGLDRTLLDYAKAVAFIMFDKPKALIDPNWLSRAVKIVSDIENELPPYFFAGGLTPTNVNAVLESLRPYCIDVVSGVESQIGRKDPKLMREFCDTVITNCSTLKYEKGGNSC